MRLTEQDLDEERDAIEADDRRYGPSVVSRRRKLLAELAATRAELAEARGGLAGARAERDAAEAELEAWKKAVEDDALPACFNCGAPCKACGELAEAKRERDEARDLVRRLPKSQARPVDWEAAKKIAEWESQ